MTFSICLQYKPPSTPSRIRGYKILHFDLGSAQLLAFGIDQGDCEEFILPDEDNVIVGFWIVFVGLVGWFGRVAGRMESASNQINYTTEYQRISDRTYNHLYEAIHNGATRIVSGSNCLLPKTLKSVHNTHGLQLTSPPSL
jgi:hypothetical protein